MKNIKLLVLAFASLPAVAMMVGCGGGSTPKLEEAEQIFTNKRAYFDISDEKLGNLSVDLEVSGNLGKVSCGKVTAESGEASMIDNVLTVSPTFLKKLNFGERILKAVVDDKTINVDLFCATKVIKTAEEFQNINEDLDGAYILGNDIDLSSIDNFEPLGYMWDEQNVNNHYFHGILEGNGFSVKNAKVYWADDVASNYNVYSESGTYRFKSTAHVNGDNIGLFQMIGSSGVVRNTKFSNIKVRGRTIVGALAGNVAGTVTNCYLDSSCSVQMGTHFYDDDCNMGGVFGIVGGGANVSNVISEITSLQCGAASGTTVGGVTIEKAGIYLDWDESYREKTGNGWDHGNEADHNPWWKFCAVDKENTTDSNGSPTCGMYSFVGKCWGSVLNCVARSFKITPMDGTPRDVFFGQTHLAANKPTSGDSDLGKLENCAVLSADDIKKAENYGSFDTGVWDIKDGSVPTLRAQYGFTQRNQA